MLRKLNQSDFKIMPWKNGQGFTTELYRIDVAGDMAFRVSSAKVERSGPFSDFAGYDRTLVNLGPGVMGLSIDQREQVNLAPLAPLHFDGGSSSLCFVTEMCEDLNIFCRRGSYFASTFVRTLAKPEFLPLLETAGLIIFVIEGDLCAHGPDQREYIVGRREALVKDLGGPDVAGPLMLASASKQPCVFCAISFRLM